MSQASTANSAPQASAEAQGVVALLKRHLLPCTAIMLVAGAAAVAVIAMSTKEYHASATISLENSRLQSTPTQPVFAPVVVDLFAVKAAIETISSPETAERILDALALWDDSEITQQPSLSHRARVAVADLTDPIRLRWPALAPVLSGIRGTEPSDDHAHIVGRFLTRLTVSQTPQSLLISVGYVSRDPEKAARIANGIADAFVGQLRRDKVDQLNAATSQLQEMTDRFHERLLAAQAKLKNYRDTLGIVELGSAANMTVSAQNTTDLNARYLAARSERTEREASLQELRTARAKSYASAVSIGGFGSAHIEQLQLQRASLLGKRAQLLTTYGPLYPAVATLSAEINQLDRSINSALDDLVRSKDDALQVAKSKEDALAGELGASKEQNRLQSSAGSELVDLEAQAAAARSNYESFVAYLGRTGESASIQTPDARLLSRATPPLSPSLPRPAPIVSFALLLGALSAALFVYLRESSGRSLQRIAALEEISRVPVMGLLPNLNKGNKQLTGSAFLASVDRLRLHLSTAAHGHAMRGSIVLVASSVAQEGKSTVSAALALTSARAGQRVLLIEGDTRKRSSMPDLETDGLAAIIDGRTILRDAELVEREERLFVLPSGPVWKRAIGPSEYSKLQRLIGDAVRVFDLVIIDSPPILTVPDSLIFARLADRILFLVRWPTTPLTTATRALLELAQERPDTAAICVTHLSVREMKDLSKPWAYGYGVYGASYGADAA